MGILACSMAWKHHGYESVNSNQLLMNAGTNREATLILMTANTPEIAIPLMSWYPPHFACYFWKMVKVFRIDSPGDIIPFCGQGCP